MKSFKDFIYDKSDIIAALLILIVAALLVVWRLHAIMEYPKEIIGTDDTSVEEPIDIPVDIPDDTDADTDNSSAVWEGGVLTGDVEVQVKGASASEAIQCLIDAGIFKDYEEYQSLCDTAGLDHQNVKAGTFTFEKGLTKAEIVRMINWS